MNVEIDKIGVAIVSFNPDIELLLRTVHNLKSKVEEIVIFDNGSKNFDNLKNSLNDEANVTLLHSELNIGIAAAQNKLFRFLRELKFKWVLYLDQDTEFPADGITIYEEFLNTGNYLGNIGLLSPVYVDKNDLFSTNQATNGGREIMNPIASGTLNNLEAWETIGGFDNLLFIDRVDDDYDLRLRASGFSLIEVPKVKMMHSVGEIRIVHFLGMSITVFNHNAFRKYYQARNSILFYKKHGGLANAVFRLNNLFWKVLLFEDDKHTKVVAIVSGLWNGVRTKVGNDTQGRP